MRLVVCGSIANSFVGCPVGGVKVGSALTVTTCGTHQLAALKLSGVGVTNVCPSVTGVMVTVPTGAFVRRRL